MEKIKRNFGFGYMRLPMQGDEVDLEQTRKMVDTFLDAGFNYFDTAHGYLQGKSEECIKSCLSSRYPREAYVLTDKLTMAYFKKQEDIRPFFESQLEICGVDYFDFYLMHSQNAEIFKYFKEHRAYETVLELKKEGKIRHFGISFHDRAEVLEQILTEYPQIEVVQIQLSRVASATKSAASTASPSSSWSLSRAETLLISRKRQRRCSKTSTAAALQATPFGSRPAFPGF